jgi:membrane-associated phospholipid phosphatase
MFGNAARHACCGSRRLTRLALGGVVLVLLALPVTAGASPRVRSHDDDPGHGRLEPRAGNWRTFVLDSGVALSVPPQPARRSAEAQAELSTLEADQLAREASPAIQASIAKWDAQPAFAPWTLKALALIASNGTSTAKAQRVMALVHVAMYDATVAAWHWKSVYRRPSPAKVDRALSPQVSTANVPTYPSEHAVLAGAAAGMLKALYPADATIAMDEQEAADSRLYAGTNYPSDVAAGLALGEAVAQQVLAVAAGDNLGGGQPGRLPAPGCDLTPAGCQGFWEPTFPRSPPASPTDPFAGTWHTWVIPSEGDFLPPPPPWWIAGPPPSVDSPILQAAALVDYQAVQQTTAATADGAARRLVVDTWAGVPDKHWNEIALGLEHDADLSLPEAIRISALVNAAGADAIQANWAAKYTYWEPRPQLVIRKYIDAGFVSYRPTPNEPAYSSGLATVSGAISGILRHFFPEQASALAQAGADGAISRLYDGTHYQHDIAAGVAVGHSMVPTFVRWSRCDSEHGEHDNCKDEDRDRR